MARDNSVSDDDLPANVLSAVQGGHKIEAIKLLREASGMGLANAKVIIDRASRIHGPKKPIPSFADQPKGISPFAKLLLLLLVVVAAWYYFEA